MNYVKNAIVESVKNRDVEKIHLEEKAAMYMTWLVVPSSAEIGRKLSWDILKTAKFAVKKAAKEVSEHCNKMDILAAGNNTDTDELEVYDNLLDEYRSEMANEENNIRECALEYYEGNKNASVLAEILFAYAMVKIHRAIMFYNGRKLRSMNSLVDLSTSEYAVSHLVFLLRKLGREYEKNSGIKASLYDESGDIELTVSGMRDVLTDYYNKLLSDTAMHERIQRPLIDFNKKRDEKADEVGNIILSMPIEALKIESDVFKRYGMTRIQDLYNEKGLRTDLDWTEEEKAHIIKALQEFIKEEALRYV